MVESKSQMMMMTQM
jgi:adenylosuccinate lyase